MDENHETPFEHEAFLRLFTRYEGNLRAFVASLLPAWEGVDEVMQESSIVLWRKFAQFDQSAEAGFLDWAFMIARYEVLKYRRRQATDRLRFSEDVFDLLVNTAESVTVTQDQRLRLLRECVANLEPAQLQLVKAVYEDGAAIKDVAEQIGRSPTGLYKALARIRNRLANCVQAKLGVTAAEGLI
ncbi:sigma-70 family RNA polymerase sigma factor [Novipirellula artificiosorum]|nr:sigma-70 family RNA polymerase sigma factor [Novipirellula artificiosorum]